MNDTKHASPLRQRLQQIAERDRQDLRAIRNRVAFVARVVGNLDLRNNATWPAFIGRVLDATLDGSGLYDDVTAYLSANGFAMNAEDIPLGLHHFDLENKDNLAFESTSTRAFRSETREGFPFFAVNYNHSDEWDLYISDEEHEEAVFAELSRRLWSERRALRLDARQTNTYGGLKAVLTTLDLSDHRYIGSLGEQVEHWRKFNQAGLRRSVLLQGKPGSGKSTLCLHAANLLSDRTVLISAKLFEELGSGQWRALVQVLRPQMLILDDVDRVGAMVLGMKLDVFEERNCDIPLLFFTSNDLEEIPEAFRRPGRIDQVLIVGEPDAEVRRDMIMRFAERVGVTIPEDQIEPLQQLIATHSGAHALEAIKRGKVLGWNTRPCAEDITFRKKDSGKEDSAAPSAEAQPPTAPPSTGREGVGEDSASTPEHTTSTSPRPGAEDSPEVSPEVSDEDAKPAR